MFRSCEASVAPGSVCPHTLWSPLLEFFHITALFTLTLASPKYIPPPSFSAELLTMVLAITRAILVSIPMAFEFTVVFLTYMAPPLPDKAELPSMTHPVTNAPCSIHNPPPPSTALLFLMMQFLTWAYFFTMAAPPYRDSTKSCPTTGSPSASPFSINSPSSTALSFIEANAPTVAIPPFLSKVSSVNVTT